MAGLDPATQRACVLHAQVTTDGRVALTLPGHGEVLMFHEIRFPTQISFHSSGGPERKTEIVTLGSGFEERNAVWANSRRRYNAGYGVRSLDDLHAALAFFEARLGRLYGFRFKDWSDYKSCAPGATVT